MPPSTHPTTPPRDDLFSRRPRRRRAADVAEPLVVTEPAIDGHLALLCAIGILGLTVPTFLAGEGPVLGRARMLAVGAAIELAGGEIDDDLAGLLTVGVFADASRVAGVHGCYLALPESLRMEWRRAVVSCLGDWRFHAGQPLGRATSLPPRVAAFLRCLEGTYLADAARRHQHTIQHRGPGRGGALPPRAGAPLSRLRTA